MPAQCCQHDNPECLSYEQLTEDVKIHRLGKLISAITCITEHQDSSEYAQLKENSDELTSLKEIIQLIDHNNTNVMALDAGNTTAIMTYIAQHQEQLKTIITPLFNNALKAILEGKDQEFPEQPGSFAEHPLAFYAQLINDFVEIQFFAVSEEMGTTITQTFNYCCQKLYNACSKLEEQVTKKLIDNVVDCMWLFTMLEKNKNEVIYVLGGWRYAQIMVILEELRQKYADQSLENLEDTKMIKLMEALAAGLSIGDDETEEECDDCDCHDCNCK
jgi:hypothetical protein